MFAKYRALELKDAYQFDVSAPANIAWVKYWGKKGPQLPANPSLSLTLSASKTETSLRVLPAEELSVELVFEGESRPDFALKTKNYLASLAHELPFISKTQFHIQTRNTFPHSSGIASSASSMAALARAMGELMGKLSGEEVNPQLVGSLARLGSGSACRSLSAGYMMWGEAPYVTGSSDLYAIDVTKKVHPSFLGAKDCIIVVSSREKEVSSRAGHSQMKEHPYAQARIAQAHTHMQSMWEGMQAGDWTRVGEIMEADALALHALMMTSNPGFILLEANSLEIIRLVRMFRRESQVPVYFTIDAGPNIHLIYPPEFQGKVEAFVRHELLRLSENSQSVIWDGMDSRA
jgi:diphosphomevalonate decarboxylase